MINTVKIRRILLLAAAATVMIVSAAATANAQRDPFAKANYQKERKQVTVMPRGTGTAAAPVTYGAPAIEARIEYYKRLRETAIANNAPMPKVTSVLTLNEMAVTGIFKTPRGYAAMVEATPIKLSYTIYPGEKFFDGQLVAVEENRLVFRKVTKTGEGKFVASVENKPLRQYTMKNEVEGTAPSQGEKASTQVAKTEPQPSTEQPTETVDKKVSKSPKPAKPASNPFLSPLDEMNSMPEQPAVDDKAKKGTKKPAKVAKKSDKQ